MIKLDLQTIARATQGALIGENCTALGVGTDTRADLKGKLFVALKGERFNAHNFIAKAEEQGAVALLVSQPVQSALPQVMVTDTRLALGQLAAFWRKQCDLKVVGLTGSVGKTTVKEMIASILRHRAPTLATKGNLNNDFGVPLTLLELSQAHKYAVIEMGANHQNEIAYCTDLVQPDVALITKIAPAHIEGFGSIEGVADAKAEIFSHAPQACIAILNAELAYKKRVERAIGDRKTIGFGMHHENDVFASHVVLDVDGYASFTLHYQGQQQNVKLSMPGAHNVMNALAAATAALALNFSLTEIAEGLAKTPLVKGRLNQLKARNGATVIDDTYNANLASMCAAIDLLSTKSHKTVAVLGDMGELGDSAEEMHREVGVYAHQKSITALYTVGVLSANTSKAYGPSAKHFESMDALIAHLNKSLTGTEAILIKGSRSARMERVVQALCEPVNNNQQGGAP